MSHDPSASYSPADPHAGPLRLVLLAVVAIGMAGLAAELALLEHYDDAWQWVPLVALGLGPAACAAVWRRPGRAALGAFRALMGLYVAAGVLGVYLHLRGNFEFERERDPSLGGSALLWEAMRGATPALAPGALAQLGLVGLAFAFRHPALRR
jgi:hypothetical protein